MVSILFCIFAISFTLPIRAIKYQHDDMIVISADTSDGIQLAEENTRSKRHGAYPLYYIYGYEQPTPELTPVCYTTNGEPGICAPLSQCYPSLYTLADENGLRNISNLPLAEDLLVASGPCSYNPEGYAQNIVCCPTLLRAPPRYPNYPGFPGIQNRPMKMPPVIGGGSGGGAGASDPPMTPECGTRVVFGHEAKPGTYPWMTALIQRGRQFCGASLIDSKHILTAAHCVSHLTGSDVANLRVYLGAHDVTAPSEPHRQVYQVSKIYYNRGFSFQTLKDDIAILKLTNGVPKFSEKVLPICLSTGHPSYDTPGSKAKLSGWGKLRDKGPQPAKLQDVDLPVLTNAQCSAKYGGYAPAGITANMVCAGGSGGDACQVDSGGPLMRPFEGNSQSKRTEQIGVVSWGIGCGTYPGVYTRVDKYLDWVNRVRQMP